MPDADVGDELACWLEQNAARVEAVAAAQDKTAAEWAVELLDGALRIDENAVAAMQSHVEPVPARKLRAWYVCDMDDGIIRVEDTKSAALAWAKGRSGGNVLPGRKRTSDGFYEYYIGTDEYDRRQVWIARGDAALRAGFDDLDQAPLYPVKDDPYKRVERKEPDA